MRSIIIPTDFSSSADNAMHYGAKLAMQLNLSVVLLHVYQMPIAISDMPVMMISAEELKKSADDGLSRSAEELKKSYPNINIKSESRLGDINDELEEMCKEAEPFAVVMGSHNATGLERLLIGSTTLSVVREIKHPVIAVPPAAEDFKIKNIAFATDLLNVDAVPHQAISKIVQAFNAQLNIIHVQTEADEKEDTTAVEKIKSALSALQPNYRIIKDEDVLTGINNYVQENAIDLLITIPHKHSFWQRFFSKTHSAEVLNHAQVPVLFLPE